MKRRKYYFIIYHCKQYGWKPLHDTWVSTGVIESICQAVIKEHPLAYQIKLNEKYGVEFMVSGGHKQREEYMVLNWKELTNDEYRQFAGNTSCSFHIN